MRGLRILSSQAWRNSQHETTAPDEDPHLRFENPHSLLGSLAEEMKVSLGYERYASGKAMHARHRPRTGGIASGVFSE